MRKLLGMFPDRTLLAVDGGASKADLALVDVKGNVLAAMRRRGSYHLVPRYNGAASRARDGRGPGTLLERLVPAHFGMARPTAVMEAVYTGKLDSYRLSEGAPLVFQAAGAGDRVAQGLVDDMAQEIVVTANAAIKRLHVRERDVHVVLGGGVLRAADDELIARITAGIRRQRSEEHTSELQSPC